MGTDFKANLDLTERSFMQRAVVSYNQLPASLRQVPKLETFKKKLKVWVFDTVPL